MSDDDPRMEQLESIYDDRGRLTDPDGQVIRLRQTDDETTWVLMPTRDYVERRSLRYRRYCAWALGLAAGGSLVHWAVTRPEDVSGYVLTTAFIALMAALALKAWNSAIRCGLVVRAGRRIRVSIATVKVTVHPLLAERLGLDASDDGRFWRLYRVDPNRRRMYFMLAQEAFPTLPEFLDQTVPGNWQDLRKEAGAEAGEAEG